MKLPMILSYLRALTTLYQHFHWKTSGYSSHLLYERLYNETNEELDKIAEKIIGITNDPNSIDPLKDILATTLTIKKHYSPDKKPDDYYEVALQCENELIKLIKDAMEDEQTDGVQNMLQGIADLHEGHIYLLQQQKREAGMLVKLYKMAHELDKVGAYDQSKEIEAVMREMMERTGLSLDNMVALADYLDDQGLVEAANKIDGMIKKATKK